MNLLPPLTAGAWLPSATALAFLALGFAAGLLHFGLLRRTVGAITEGRVKAAVIHAIIRFGATGAVFYLAARSGAVILLSAMLGLMAARYITLRSHRRLAG